MCRTAHKRNASPVEIDRMPTIVDGQIARESAGIAKRAAITGMGSKLRR
jgi:hypothetical protein